MIWLPAYLRRDWAGARERAGAREPRHVFFCVADHFEPRWGGADLDVERGRVAQWAQKYPRVMGDFRDVDGRHPRHTFFYPAEEYRAEHLDRLGELVEQGFGEVEVHLHHDRDTSEGLRRTLDAFNERLRSHGHLGTDRASGRTRFGFVHGNWTLDNSDPMGRWCGVNDELRVLRAAGCYADFTLPSAPSAAQTRRINSIYYADDDPERPKSHDDGVEVRVGGEPSGDLMIVQGPLVVRWWGGKLGLLPRLDTANLGRAGATPARLRAWINASVCVAGRPEWVFVKAHTHGCIEWNWDALFGDPIRRLHTTLTTEYNDGRRWRLHYVTAREMYNIVKAAERGLDGEPGDYRDLDILPPPRAEATAAGNVTHPQEARTL